MESNPADQLEVTLVKLSGETVAVTVKPTSTVFEIKQAAAEALGHRWPMIRLQVDGTDLGNNELAESVAARPLQVLIVPNRREAAFNAALAEQTGRWDEMARLTVCIAHMGGELAPEERRLLLTAFSARADRALASWRSAQQAERAETHRGNELYAGFAAEERQKYGAELSGLCSEFFQLLSEYVVPEASSDEWKAFWEEQRSTFASRYLDVIR
mmetsp:Transcript_22112/g.69014  ORF Transcript_22112/g.69014 Transcript_22112/m.69014 type:complete len:214 (+) Transcript_22112:54-695(+)